jgi:acetyl esterase/lipase
VIEAGTCEGDVCTPQDLGSWTAVPYTPSISCGPARVTCRLTMDILAPIAKGERPIALFIAGGPNAPDQQGYVRDAAFPVAAQDAVAIIAGWRQSSEFGGGWPQSFQDVACAVGVARAIGPAYGGDPKRVVLVGHSLGGWATTVLALSPEAMFAPPDGQCNRTRGSLHPEAVVTLAGAFQVLSSSDLGTGFFADFFGGSRADRPERWRQADPELLASGEGAPHGIPMTVVQGTRDATVAPSVARSFASVLREHAFSSRLVMVREVDHLGLLTAPDATEAILAALSATG